MFSPPQFCFRHFLDAILIIDFRTDEKFAMTKIYIRDSITTNEKDYILYFIIIYHIVCRM